MREKRIRKLLSIAIVCAMMAGQVVCAEELEQQETVEATEKTEESTVEKEKTEEESKGEKEQSKDDVPVTDKQEKQEEKVTENPPVIEETVEGNLSVKEKNIGVNSTDLLTDYIPEDVVSVQVTVEDPTIGTVSEVKMTSNPKVACVIFTAKVAGSTTVWFNYQYADGGEGRSGYSIDVLEDEPGYYEDAVVSMSKPRYMQFTHFYEAVELSQDNVFMISSDPAICDITEVQYEDEVYGLVTGKKEGTANIYTVVSCQDENGGYVTYSAKTINVKNSGEVSPVKDVLLHSYMLESWCDNDEDGVVSQQEVEEMSYLEAASVAGTVETMIYPNKSIQSLEGLENAKNLEHLFLVGNSQLTNIDSIMNLENLKTINLEGTGVSAEDRWKLADIQAGYNLVKGEKKGIEKVEGALGNNADVKITVGSETIARIMKENLFDGGGDIWSYDVTGYRLYGIEGGQAVATITLGEKTCEVAVNVEGFNSNPIVGEDKESGIEVVDDRKNLLLDSNGNLWESYPEYKKVDTGVVNYMSDWVYTTGDTIYAGVGEADAGMNKIYKLYKNLNLCEGTNKVASDVIRVDGRYALTMVGDLIDLVSQSSCVMEDTADWATTITYTGETESDPGWSSPMKVVTYVLKKDGTLWRREEVSKDGDGNQSFTKIDENVTELFEYGYVKNGQVVGYDNTESYNVDQYKDLSGIKELIYSENQVIGYIGTDGNVYIEAYLNGQTWLNLGKQTEIGNVIEVTSDWFSNEEGTEDYSEIYILTEDKVLYYYNEQLGTLAKWAEDVEELISWYGMDWKFRTSDGKYYDDNGNLIEITEDNPLSVTGEDGEYSLYLMADGKMVLKRNGIEVMTNVKDLIYKWGDQETFYVIRTDGTLWDVNGVPKQVIDFASEYLRGDVNEDSKINLKDLRMVLYSISGKQALTIDQKAIADINGDGNADVQDLRTILRYVCGKTNAL